MHASIPVSVVVFLHSGVKREPHKKKHKQINFYLNVNSIQSRFGHPQHPLCPMFRLLISGYVLNNLKCVSLLRCCRLLNIFPISLNEWVVNPQIIISSAVLRSTTLCCKKKKIEIINIYCIYQPRNKLLIKWQPKAQPKDRRSPFDSKHVS